MQSVKGLGHSADRKKQLWAEAKREESRARWQAISDRVALAEANLPLAQRLSLEMNRAKQLVKRKLFDMADYAWPFGNRVLGF